MMKTFTNQQAVSCRTAWISDVHLGSKDCQVEHLSHFLNALQCDTLYLLGDIVDLWAMRKRFWWPASHYDIVKQIFNIAKNGTRVIYIPGNHDETMRDYVENMFGPIEVMEEAVHETEDGRRLLLFHGDILDERIRFGWLTKIAGDIGYPLLLTINRWVSKLRKLFGCNYWSLATYTKGKFEKAQDAIKAYENEVIEEVKRRGLDGAICGHIHKPSLFVRDNIMYCNDGDWVEHCTAMIEDEAGEIFLLDCSKSVDYEERPKKAANDAGFESSPDLIDVAKVELAKRNL